MRSPSGHGLGIDCVVEGESITVVYLLCSSCPVVRGGQCGSFLEVDNIYILIRRSGIDLAGCGRFEVGPSGFPFDLEGFIGIAPLSSCV